MTESPDLTAALVIIGNEVLSGRTQDANLAWLARELNILGIRMMDVRVVRDDETAIVEAVNALRARRTYVFTTGGIGPTHDDITADCVAKAFGVPLLLNAEAKARLMRNYARPEDLNEMRLRMARIPEGAELIDNPISHAPGFRLGNVFVLAGVPRIMQAMFGALQTGLRRGRPMLSRTVTVRVPEGLIAAGLAATQDRHPAVEIGSYPGGSGPGHFQVSVVLRGKEAILVNRAAEEVRGLAGRLTETPIEDDGPLPCP